MLNKPMFRNSAVQAKVFCKVLKRERSIMIRQKENKLLKIYALEGSWILGCRACVFYAIIVFEPICICFIRRNAFSYCALRGLLI